MIKIIIIVDAVIV